jgi:sugar/nucleoside kinase (ribokinase family)
VRDELARRGIDTAHLVVRDAPNPFAVILIVERTGERIVLWNRDEAFALRPEELPVDAIASARVVHVDDVDQAAAIAAARMGREAGAQVTSDIDRLTERTEDLVSAVTVPIFAEHVPPALTGEPDPERALRSLRRRHAGLLCVTLGARGAMLLDGDRLYSEPGFRVDTVDTTGAGDVFRGAFIRALLRGEAPDAMLRFANAAAALSCTRLGAIGGVPSLEEVERLLRESPARP